MDDILRTCSFCCTKRPLSQLVPSADSYVCQDQAACDARAAASGLYSMPEDQLELASLEARQGAYVPQEPAPLPSYRPEPGDAVAQTLAAEQRADAGRTAPSDALDISQ